jgi:hypothetical protein
LFLFNFQFNERSMSQKADFTAEPIVVDLVNSAPSAAAEVVAAPLPLAAAFVSDYADVSISSSSIASGVATSGTG